MPNVDIYGHINDGSEIVIAMGNHNDVHGLLQYLHSELQLFNIADVLPFSVARFIIKYEPNYGVDGKLYFSLQTPDESAYLGVKLRKTTNTNTAHFTNSTALATYSDEKEYFWIDHSSVDRSTRNKLLSGALMILKTRHNNEDCTVYWNVKNFERAQFVMFLPTLWYQKADNICSEQMGTAKLVQQLQQPEFKGYSRRDWCENADYVTHCENSYCGSCLGRCNDPRHICQANTDNRNFMCIAPNLESDQVPVANSSDDASTWWAVLVIFLLVVVIVIGLWWWQHQQ